MSAPTPHLPLSPSLPPPLLLRGCSRELLAGMEPGGVDAIVCDPPYELGFMGKAWDATGIAFDPAFWALCFRVLKPGGHLLAFGGSRTHHRVWCAVEDAGFELRDTLLWLYGSGFPKSLDVGKAIDRAAGAVREVVGEAKGAGSQNTEALGKFAPVYNITAPATPEAQQWQGWGTALKPAHEPILLARKPFSGTVAATVMAHGTGALNLDACRVEAEKQTGWNGLGDNVFFAGLNSPEPEGRAAAGRFPPNLLHDGSPGVVATFPAEAGAGGPVRGDEPSASTASAYGQRARVPGSFHADSGSAARFFPAFPFTPEDVARAVEDRPWLYHPKATTAEREAGLDALPVHSGGEATDREDGSAGLSSPRAGAGRLGGRRNTHPTVKPVALMRWLCRLITPPGGRVLDPFTGSGTTGVAAEREGFAFVGCELNPDYHPIIEARLAHAREERLVEQSQELPGLFAEPGPVEPEQGELF